MSYRVEICGIDTSTLPKLSHTEQMMLLESARKGSDNDRNTFLMANMRLVLSIVSRFNTKRDNTDDIFQVGCMGLIKAMDNFNTSFNLRFSTYAVPMIIGEIKRYIRDSSPVHVSRSLRDTAYKALTARGQLERTSGEETTLEQVAEVLNMPLSEVAFALDAISDTISLYESAYNDGSDTLLVMDQIKDTKNTDENWLTRVSLNDALDKLTERERQILLLRFYDGRTQIEVSNEVGISQAQVSRLEKNAIKTMGSYLD